ncbi:hypothetical protein [Saccharopolyspora shandongensis]|uniref:hypothetical protein n=1 Tax=Saccharopolyspora shandongensis TaxID=418495 RepID=UPI0033C11535
MFALDEAVATVPVADLNQCEVSRWRNDNREATLRQHVLADARLRWFRYSSTAHPRAWSALTAAGGDQHRVQVLTGSVPLLRRVRELTLKAPSPELVEEFADVTMTFCRDVLRIPAGTLEEVAGLSTRIAGQLTTPRAVRDFVRAAGTHQALRRWLNSAAVRWLDAAESQPLLPPSLLTELVDSGADGFAMQDALVVNAMARRVAPSKATSSTGQPD